MPRYFLDVHDGIVVIDTAGTDLPDLEQARAHALKVAAGYVADPKMLSTDGGAIVVEVRDATAKLLTVSLVFNIRPE